MARPRFNGRGFTNPLNPLGFHSENRYREATPLGSNFMSNEMKYEAETRVFEAGLAKVVLTFAKEAGEAAAKAAMKELQQLGVKSPRIAKGIAAKIGKEVQEQAIKAADNAKAAGKSAKGQLDEAVKAAKGAGKKGAKEIGEGAGKGVDDAIEGAAKNADNALVDATKGAGREFPKPKLTTVAKGSAGAVILVGAYQFMGFTDRLFGGDPWKNLTGENCPDKVEDRGISEGDEGYAEAIEECQAEAEQTTLKVFAGAGLGIFLLLLLLLKPKKKKKEDDEDE